jgi:hypothetical protein
MSQFVYSNTEECNLQKRQVDFAYCECRQAHIAEIETAKTECITDENRAHVGGLNLRQPSCTQTGGSRRMRRHMRLH